MTFGEERAICPSILTLPDDVLFVIISHCQLSALGRLSLTCKRFLKLVKHDSVWKDHWNGLTVLQSYAKCRRIPLKEQCRLAVNWCQGAFTEDRVIPHRTKQLPWLQLDIDDYLWTSYEKVVRCYRRKRNGRVAEIPERLLRNPGSGDVTRFVCKDGKLVAGYRDGSVSAFDTCRGVKINSLTDCHQSDVHCVDIHETVVVSGSRDATIKVWDMDFSNTQDALKYQIDAQERVWSVAVNPSGESFVVGTAGHSHVSPLRIWHLESGEQLASLGTKHRHGAGVLDVQYESNHVLLTCGYDTYVRMWDLRKSSTHCVAEWEDPFDSTVYCVRSDNRDAFVTGTARHGLVRLWDKRMTQPVQMYYTGGRASSPVYALAFDPRHLYVALDRGVNMLDFSTK